MALLHPAADASCSVARTCFTCIQYWADTSWCAAAQYSGCRATPKCTKCCPALAILCHVCARRHVWCAFRPPFSCGVFSQAEMRAVLDWMLATYYRHYKLYQYAFTNRSVGQHKHVMVPADRSPASKAGLHPCCGGCRGIWHAARACLEARCTLVQTLNH